eukprot:7666738-Pyramimonas_sp.AAC.1
MTTTTTARGPSRPPEPARGRSRLLGAPRGPRRPARSPSRPIEAALGRSMPLEAPLSPLRPPEVHGIRGWHSWHSWFVFLEDEHPAW